MYLKSESQDTSLEYKDGILQVYGSNFISIVKDLKFQEGGNSGKSLFLIFTKADCALCDRYEEIFNMLKKEIADSHFVFAKMDIDKNYATLDYR